MPKHLTIAILHDLGAAEVRRRLDRQTEWARQRLERDSIQVTIAPWSEDGRSFAARALGQDIRGSLRVAEDRLELDATLPWTIGVFAPAIEAAARHYAARLLAPVAPT